ncbi:MAG: DUF5716 family protein, partial [Lachnospiraceae bacterium]
VAGIDLCDDYCQMSSWLLDKNEPSEIEWEEGKRTCLIPMVICKRRGADEWLIGESAFQEALMNKGILSDQLIHLVSINGNATMEGYTYSAANLLMIYIAKCVEFLRQKNGNSKLLYLTFTVQNLNLYLVNAIYNVCDSIGMTRKNVCIISHEEASTWYFLNQKQFGAGKSAQFDLTDKGLYYYEMTLSRAGRTVQANMHCEKLDEGFHLSILEQASGKKMADSILLSCAKRLLEGKNISVIYLTGKGLNRCQEWSQSFIEYICVQNRKVFYCKSLFAKGAAYMAMSQIPGNSVVSYLMHCEGMVNATLSVNALYKGGLKKITFVQDGQHWYEPMEPLEFLLNDERKIELLISQDGNKSTQKMVFDLNGIFPERPSRTTRVSFQMKFLSQNQAKIAIEDLGFGELFPASGEIYKGYIQLNE